MTTGHRPGLAAFAAAVFLLAHAANALAQPATGSATQPGTAAPARGYAEGVANATFGNVTSQAYGGEFGYAVWRDAQLYVEVGQVRDATTATLSTSAQSIATALTQLQPAAVSYSVRQPYTYFTAGIRYRLNTATKVTPYVIAGFGVAQVKRDVTYTLSSAEAASQYVTLGEDLSGTHSSALFNAGVGVEWPAWQSLILDFQFRFHRVFAEDEAMNVARAGVGIGVRF
jgi:opacity protein-like surface antigen